MATVVLTHKISLQEDQMHEYLQQFGFDPEECGTIVGAYHVARGGGAGGRTDLLLVLQSQFEGLDLMEQWVDDDAVIGDAYENLARVDSDRTGTRTLMDKVGSLSDREIADVGIYCLRLLER